MPSTAEPKNKRFLYSITDGTYVRGVGVVEALDTPDAEDMVRRTQEVRSNEEILIASWEG